MSDANSEKLSLLGPHRLCENCGCGVMHCGCDGRAIMRQIGGPAFEPAMIPNHPLRDGAIRAAGLSWLDRQRLLTFHEEETVWFACEPQSEGILAPLVPLGLADEKIIARGPHKGKRAFGLTALGRRTLAILVDWEARLDAWEAAMCAKIDEQIARAEAA